MKKFDFAICSVICDHINPKLNFSSSHLFFPVKFILKEQCSFIFNYVLLLSWRSTFKYQATSTISVSFLFNLNFLPFACPLCITAGLWYCSLDISIIFPQKITNISSQILTCIPCRFYFASEQWLLNLYHHILRKTSLCALCILRCPP